LAARYIKVNVDNTTTRLAALACTLHYSDLSPSALHEAERRFFDSIACLFGGYDSEPARIARDLASESSGKASARIIGSGLATTMEMATFANTTAVRYLDYNDAYIAQGSGHPSDMLPALLAVADAHRLRGRALLLAFAASYEVFAAIADTVHLRQRGWDQGVAIVLGSAAGTGLLLGLNQEQLGHALSIAITSNIATRQTRSGELSMWKGCATAASSRAGVFAALLAQRGMTGPDAAFEGRHGVWETVTGPFAVADRISGEPFAIERSNLKAFPTEYHSQAPLWLIEKLRPRVSIDNIEGIHVRTYHMAWSEIGSEPEKWRPRTRETADHSLPYLLAHALRHGNISLAAFEQHKLDDSETHALMDRITIVEVPEFTQRFPKEIMTEIEITMRDGTRFLEQATYPRGHVRNPMSDSEIEAKFDELCSPFLSTTRRKACLDFIRSLQQDVELDTLYDLTHIGDLQR